MDPSPSPAAEAIALAEARSDYGSDIDEEALQELLIELEGISVEPLLLEALEEHESHGTVVHIPVFSSQGSTKTESTQYYSAVEEQLLEGGNRRRSIPECTTRYSEERSPWAALAFDVASLDKPQDEGIKVEKEQEPEFPNTRSPLERFRKPPKKPLSVTDIVSPAWCELQYWYSLTKYGKVKATPAMKQGSHVHQELEKQVHDIVPIQTKTREDTWGLRIWNIIQGLRTLRGTGLTRELEIWGVLDGEVINGVIDELSYECPDPELEYAMELSKDSSGSQRAPNQLSITDFYSKSANGANPLLTNPHLTRKIYLTDIKTRASKALPQGSSLHPVQIQLQLYHRILTDLASGAVPSAAIFSRYRLDPEAPFSALFINEIAALDQNFAPEADDNCDHARLNTTEDSLTELERHNTLNSIWDLLQQEFAQTIPSSDALSPILRAEFRSRTDGTVLGSRTFVMDEEGLEKYVQDEMKWWRGERETKGVDVEEAFKCRICEFAEGCEWRIKKVEDAVEKSRLRRSSGKKKSEI